MENNIDYTKYYDLEEYLFTDVRDAFQHRGYLTPEEFFAIVIWKAERAKSRVKLRLLKRGVDLGVTVERLTRQIHEAATDEGRLRIFLEDWEFQLPMSSAILSVLYPVRFTVYDVRVRDELGIRGFAGRKDQVERYFSEFVPRVRSVEHPGTLRDKDRYLWGKSWREGLQSFLED
jgi:hypothetical protein